LSIININIIIETEGCEEMELAELVSLPDTLPGYTSVIQVQPAYLIVKR
jgi:hypothetical protein